MKARQYLNPDFFAGRIPAPAAGAVQNVTTAPWRPLAGDARVTTQPARSARGGASEAASVSRSIGIS